LEREADLAELQGALRDAIAGAGRTAVIEGPAGVGKSALLGAAAASLDGDARVLRATGSELERPFAFGAVRQLFDPVVAGADPDERRRLLRGGAAPARWVVGPPAAAEASEPRAAAGFAVLHAIYWLAANLAATGPLVLVVDDLHWLDEESLQAVDFLARRIGELPIALLVGLRLAEPDAPAALLDSVRSAPGAVRVAPAPLSPAAVAALVRERFPDAPAEVCAAFHEVSAGNPLYARELVLAIAASGATLDEEAVRRAAVPSLADSLARRVARIAPGAEALATTVAVLGDGAPLRLAASLAEIDHDAAARVARRLTEIEVLAKDDPAAFAHPVLRRSLYDHLPASERERLHDRAARLLHDAGGSPEAIAAHVRAVPPRGSVEAATCLVDAARFALGRAAPAAAVRLLRRALAEQAPEPPRAELLHDLGKAEMLVRDPAAVAHLQEAFELAQDPRPRVAIGLVLCELLSARGEWEPAQAILRSAKSELPPDDHELLGELAVQQAASTAFDPRLVADFDREHESYEELSKGEGWAARALAAVLAAMACARSEPRDRVLEHVDRALRGGRLIEERGGPGWVGPHLIPAIAYYGAYDRALEVSDAIAAAGRRSGSLIDIACGLFGRGMVHTRTGDLRAAEAILRSLLDLTRDSGMTLWLASFVEVFVDAIAERPQLGDVAEMTAAIELDPAFAAAAGGAQLLDGRGRIALALGERDRSLADLRACAQVYEAVRIGPAWSPWRSALALAVRDEDPDYAARLVSDELELARTSGVPEVEGAALRTAGVIEETERAVELLRASVAMLAPSRARLEHARSLVELGAALRDRGRVEEAREQLAAGMDIAHRCGAERLVARAGDELRATGARPRRAARSGRDALTARELRVARLAADGLSNVEIAQELYVTAKTVEAHLSAVYGKLGLSGRGARERLRDALEPPRKT
jgi:DNA-binding CsgD family transcriptional regulator